MGKSKPIYKTRTLQTAKVNSFRNHAVADVELGRLINKISLTSRDVSYKKYIKPFLADKKNVRLFPVFKKSRTLVESFFRSRMDKDTFKRKWRDIMEHTDEHVSTQTVFIMAEAMRSNKAKIEIPVAADTLAVLSVLRSPTAETGHDAMGKGKFAHPTAPDASMHVPGNKTPNHALFDLTRRTLGHEAAEGQLAASPNDGTGALLELGIETSKFTSHWIGAPFATDNKLRSKKNQRAAHKRREENKLIVRTLSGQKKGMTQKKTAPQYAGSSSPAARSLTSGRKSRKRARSLSPERDQ